MKKNINSRLDYLDNIKWFLAIIVIMHHSFDHFRGVYPKYGDVNRPDKLLFITEFERRANSNVEQSQTFFICGKVFTAGTKSINKRDVYMKF